MPIHDQTYRRYQGERVAPGYAWSVIAVTGVRELLRKKLFLVVMVFSLAQFVVRAVLLYLAANFPQMEVLAPTAGTFRDFFEQQGFFVFIVTVYVGAGLIATDQRVHALRRSFSTIGQPNFDLKRIAAIHRGWSRTGGIEFTRQDLMQSFED